MKQLSIKELNEAAIALANEDSLNEGDAFILLTGVRDEQEQGTNTSAIIRGKCHEIMKLLDTLLDDEDIRVMLLMAISIKGDLKDE